MLTRRAMPHSGSCCPSGTPACVCCKSNHQLLGVKRPQTQAQVVVAIKLACMQAQGPVSISLCWRTTSSRRPMMEYQRQSLRHAPPPPLPPLHHVAVMILNHYTMMPRHVAMCLGIIIQWLSVMTATRCHPPAPPITHLRTSLRLSTNLKRGTALVPSLLGRCARYGGSWSPNSACMWMAPR